MKLYDLIIIGAGPAGVNAASVASDNGLSVLILEKGRDLIKRRDLISGWFGRGIFDAGNICAADYLFNNKKAIKESLKPFKKILSDKNNFSNLGTTIATYYFNKLQKKIDIIFNAEALKVEKENEEFLVHTSKYIFHSKKCLISTGKYSIELVKSICNSLNINTISESIDVGARIEIPTSRVKDLNEKLIINDPNISDVRINSFVGEWEELDILSAFGYKPPGKESRKTNFMVGLEIKKPLEDVIKDIKIVNILSNDRIKCERVFEYMEGKSVLKHINIFDNLKIAFEKIERFLPSFTNYATMYVPEVRFSGIFFVSTEMKSSLFGLYGAGECTSKVSNISGAMGSGIVAGQNIVKEI